jgi:Uma2 family endonuclease
MGGGNFRRRKRQRQGCLPYRLATNIEFPLVCAAHSFKFRPMAPPQTVRHLSLEEYYEREALAEFKSEYYAGEVFAMAGGSFTHSQICAALIGELTGKLKGKSCVPYDSNLRIKVPATGLVTYPDVSIFCQKPEADPRDKDKQTAINPTVVIEVLSPSTEAYDRGKKTENYRQLESLKAYLLVSQSEPHVELYERHGDGFWFLTEASGLDSSLAIPAVNIQIDLAAIYERVDFGAPPGEPSLN